MVGDPRSISHHLHVLRAAFAYAGQITQEDIREIAKARAQAGTDLRAGTNLTEQELEYVLLGTAPNGSFAAGGPRLATDGGRYWLRSREVTSPAIPPPSGGSPPSARVGTDPFVAAIGAAAQGIGIIGGAIGAAANSALVSFGSVGAVAQGFGNAAEFSLERIATVVRRIFKPSAPDVDLPQWVGATIGLVALGLVLAAIVWIARVVAKRALGEGRGASRTQRSQSGRRRAAGWS